MTMGLGVLNNRILVIDDEESVRDSFRTVLCPHIREDVALQAAASVLFGEAPPPRTSAAMPRFEVDTASNGREGLWLVEAALARGQPYAAIFCDMRMPGWDGLETIEHIRERDRRAQIIFVTAYSDHSMETIIERAGVDVGYFVKPFLTDEVKQLATKVVLEWNKARELEDLMQTVTTLSGKASDIDRLVQHLLSQICAWLETESAALLRIQHDRHVRFHIGVGHLSTEQAAARLVAEVEQVSRTGEVMQVGEGLLLLPIQEYGLAIALSRSKRLTPERKYLLQVFLEHASLAIRNSQMKLRLVEQERMAAVGLALGLVVHDLRGPVGTAQMLLKVLRSGQSPRHTTDELLDKVERQLQRALAMVEDTLEFSRGHVQVRPQQVVLGGVLAEAMALWREEYAARGIQLRVEMPEQLRAYVDAGKFERVLWNLVMNARDAVTCVREAPWVEVRGREVEGGTELLVCDNGPGIPEPLRQQLFRPLVTAGKREGTGFGLAVARQIVESHGGHIAYEREEGVSRFRLFLPAECPRVVGTRAGASAEPLERTEGFDPSSRD